MCVPYVDGTTILKVDGNLPGHTYPIQLNNGDNLKVEAQWPNSTAFINLYLTGLGLELIG